MSFGVNTRNGVSLGLGTTPSLVKSPPYATLRLNFAEIGALDSILTFTRASSQTYFDSTGTLQTATTNVAAFDYDPSTLVPLGLSMWEARTNGMLYCRDFTNAAWTVKTTVTIAKDQTGIDGAVNSASSILATGATSVVSQAIVQAATSSTLSFYVKRLIGTGTITIKQTASTLDITALINSSTWTRVTLTASVLNPVIGFIIATSGDKIAVDYGSFEVGAFATPAILTTAAAATRAAPVCSTTNLGWYTQNIGTYVVAASSAIANSGANQFMARTSDNTYNNQIGVSLSSTGFANISTASGGVFNGLATAVSAITANTPFKAAGAFAANDLAFSYNAAAVVTDSALTAPASQTVFNVGSDHAGANHFNGWIASLTYYPLRLPNATLQSLST